jgi:predicted AlkP superfamily pyrophosphatase or phosphodiesterase
MATTMRDPVVLLSGPGLRERDVAAMNNLRSIMAGGEIADLTPSFPCVTCPVQAAMATGAAASGHGVVANGLYWRERRVAEMWTSPNDCIERPQLWELLSREGLKTAVWFLLHSKNCRAEYVCTPAPIHNPDGSESLWCYTRPADLYGTLRDELGHFPLHHFWGPAAGIASSRWIADSAAHAARRWRPNLFQVYLPHLDYAAQRSGPDSAAAQQAVAELDELVGSLFERLAEAYGASPLWLVAGEYAITPVDHVSYPNRVLREAGLLAVRDAGDGEQIDLENSHAWAMVDHQFSHVFVQNRDAATIRKIAELFRRQPGIAEVLAGEDLKRYELDHARSGELVLISAPSSWQAYYWWVDEERAPALARTIDIHRKPGYDPVELHFDPATRSIPLDAALVKGSHGAPARDGSQRTVMLSSEPGLLPHPTGMRDVDVFRVVARQFGIEVE